MKYLEERRRNKNLSEEEYCHADFFLENLKQGWSNKWWDDKYSINLPQKYKSQG